MILTNPTGYGIRSDSGGDGHFGASRFKWVDGKKKYYKHEGTDLLLLPFDEEPEQMVKAPIPGKLVRAFPYASDLTYKGCRIWGQNWMLKMFYFEPYAQLINENVLAGEVIGIAQDIGKKYKGVTPHIHVSLYKREPTRLVNPEDYLDTEEKRLKNGGY